MGTSSAKFWTSNSFQLGIRPINTRKLVLKIKSEVKSLKGLYHAICSSAIVLESYVSSHYLILKIVDQFCYLRPYLGMKTVFCCLLLQMVRMGMN